MFDLFEVILWCDFLVAMEKNGRKMLAYKNKCVPLQKHFFKNDF